MMSAVAESIGTYLFAALVGLAGVQWLVRLFRDIVLSFEDGDSGYDSN